MHGRLFSLLKMSLLGVLGPFVFRRILLLRRGLTVFPSQSQTVPHTIAMSTEAAIVEGPLLSGKDNRNNASIVDGINPTHDDTFARP